ncbi:hypothetical protein [Sphingomonas sp.]|uniref:hypothetical protein n=1 Tax=Sphingomonas sp. TaxID=28214 RepID=UPI002FC643D8
MSSEFEGPFFLFLGATAREGVTDKLITAGVPYKRKQLESNVENWDKIGRFLANENLAGTIAKFTNHTFGVMNSRSHINYVPQMLEAIARNPHIVFIHESFFTGKHTYADDYLGGIGGWDDQFFGKLAPEVRSKMADLMEAAGLNIVTYARNAELSVISSEFVDATARHLLFRIYMPNGRMWAGEAEKILQLFRDYLNRVSGLSVRHEQSSTRHGVVYEFFGDHTLSPSTLPEQFEQFSQFLDDCARDPDAAHQSLSRLHIDNRLIHDIVERYAKEARRLQIDLRHERERKVLSIRHRMEAELADEVRSPAELEAVQQLVDEIIPQATAVSPLTLLAAPTVQAGSITVNLQPQIISHVTGIVAQEVSGTQNFGPEPAQLLELIRIHAGSKAPELTSSVYELEDTDAKAETRITARQKLKSFLFKLGDKASGVALGVLQSYIEKKIGF